VTEEKQQPRRILADLDSRSGRSEQIATPKKRTFFGEDFWQGVYQALGPGDVHVAIGFVAGVNVA